ncbi:Protein of unknown function [Hathewaya proteolytica DSM 3090]|uniref:Putative Se/S carrier protein-like domain-containing protein n=1 Tax=Hathewaya proteolytica DSM 3090 TaxID=1121331 RepID=A0A1M6QMP8_9CLOT|nr:DUF3343 domain-containing protein [Hathewaya proteolytica]SHK21353.1 Protein of unknown function [Hathewaya proteolytica DSM 3090]
MEYLGLFFTHSGAIKFKRILDAKSSPCELMPVPRKLSSNCGICAKFYSESVEDDINDEVEKIYQVSDEGYKLIYDAE